MSILYLFVSVSSEKILFKSLSLISLISFSPFSLILFSWPVILKKSLSEILNIGSFSNLDSISILIRSGCKYFSKMSYSFFHRNYFFLRNLLILLFWKKASSFSSNTLKLEILFKSLLDMLSIISSLLITALEVSF